MTFVVCLIANDGKPIYLDVDTDNAVSDAADRLLPHGEELAENHKTWLCNDPRKWARSCLTPSRPVSVRRANKRR